MDHNAPMVVVAFSTSYIDTCSNLYNIGRDSNNMGETQVIYIAALIVASIIGIAISIVYGSERLDDDDPRF